MKTRIILLTLFLSLKIGAQNKKLKDEIFNAIEFTETDSTTVSVLRKNINKQFNKKDIVISNIYTLDFDSISNKFIFTKNLSNNIAYFKVNGSYKFYTSYNHKKLMHYKRGRVSNYSQNSAISILYNKLLKTALNEMTNSPISFCFFSEDRNLKNTMKPILMNKNQNRFITSQNLVFNNINSVIKSYYGSMERFVQEKEDRAKKNKLKLEFLNDAIFLIKSNYLNYIKYCPKDTLRNINIFIKELEQVSGALNFDQKRLLKKRILNKISFSSFNDAGAFGISFYNKDISAPVASVLTKKYFYNYFDYKSIHDSATHKAINYIFYNFIELKKKRVIDEQIPNAKSFIKKILCKN